MNLDDIAKAMAGDHPYSCDGSCEHAAQTGFLMLEWCAVQVRLVHPDARMPLLATPQAACYDLYACFGEKVKVNLPRGVYTVSTGLSLSIPNGWEGQIRPRSSLASRGIVVIGPGTIDSTYRSVVQVVLFNASALPWEFKHGDCIARLAVRPVPQIKMVEASRL